ncbi:MAG: PAS domain S-box protein [Deltaproteobacteria bacterium]|nr:PAS domain S-box protein [Deltaproteobacteria bacterium]
MMETLEVLLVEDNPGDQALIRELLTPDEGTHYHVEALSRLADACGRIRSQPFDLVLLDLSLPDSQGLDTFTRMRDAAPGLPIVVLTGNSDETVATHAVQAGAQDYLVKGSAGRELARAVRYAVERNRLEEKHRSLFENAEVGMFRTALDASVVIDINRKGAELFGRTRARMVGVELTSFCVSPPRTELWEVLRTAGAVRGFELEIRTGAGEPRTLLLSARAFPSQGIVEGSAIDITERKVAAEAARRAKEEWERTFDAVPDLIALIDQDHRIVRANRAMATRLGAQPDALMGRRCFEVIHGTSEPATDCPHERMIRSGLEEYAELAASRLGGFFAMTATPLRDGAGNLVGCVHIARDITERRQHEEALLASETRFRAIFDNVSDGLLLADPGTGALIMANRSICRMLGYSADELTGMSIRDLLGAGDPAGTVDPFDSLMHGAAGTIIELPVMRKDGAGLVMEVGSAPIVIEGLRLVMGSFRDVTETRALEASMARADRLATMGMLAAGVAHEINNPLAYVLANVDDLASYLPQLSRSLDAIRSGQPLGDAAALDPAALAGAVDRVQDALDGLRRIKEIARGLGSFSRVESSERGPVDLAGAIRAAAAMAHNEVKYRATLSVQVDDAPQVLASEGKLSQVFLNLLVNAAHAIPEGDLEHNRIVVRSWTEGPHALVEVWDTGVGIPKENMDRVFDPFFTTKGVGKGTGLGLSICKHLVTELGGDIRVESAVGWGTRFLVRLPIANAELKEAPAPDNAGVPAERGPRGRILLVDDEAPICKAINRLLGVDHDVTIAPSGEAAQAILGQDPSFDVILCDLMMPGITGMELHAWLAQRDPATASRVVFLTGGAFTPRAAAYLASAGNPTISKPFDPAALRELVAERVRGEHDRATVREPVPVKQ